MIYLFIPYVDYIEDPYEVQPCKYSCRSIKSMHWKITLAPAGTYIKCTSNVASDSYYITDGYRTTPVPYDLLPPQIKSMLLLLDTTEV